MLIDYAVWVSRLMLGMVFGLSAAGKFLDGAGTRRAVGEFGVPVRAVPPVAAALPWVEAVLAVAVLLPATAVPAAAGALALLLVFTAAVLWLLRAGKRPSCACFGAASERPIGWGTVARNGVLLLLAAAVLAGALRRSDVPAVLPADNVLGLTLFALLTAVLLWLAGELAAVRRRLDQQALASLGAEGLPVGAVAPEFALVAAGRAERVTLEDLLEGGRGVLLVFVHPGCELCAALARELPRWQARVADTVTIVAVGNGEPEEHARWGSEHGLGDIPVLVQQGNEAALRYRVRGTPSAVLIDREGRIAAPVGRGAMAVRDLILRARPSASPLTGRKRGGVPKRVADQPIS